MMTKEKVVDELRGVEFLHEFPEEYLNHLADISRLVEFPARSTIFREKDEARDVYVVISGQVSLVICAPGVGCRELMKVGPGDLIGWSPLVGRSRLSDTAHAVTGVTAIAIPGEKLLGLCDEFPKFGFDFIHRAAKVLASRLSATRLQMLKMTGHALPEIQIESD